MLCCLESIEALWGSPAGGTPLGCKRLLDSVRRGRKGKPYEPQSRKKWQRIWWRWVVVFFSCRPRPGSGDESRRRLDRSIPAELHLNAGRWRGRRGKGAGAEDSDGRRRVETVDTKGRRMEGSRSQRYMFTQPEEVAVLYTESHVMCGRERGRRERFARMGGAAKPEAAAASPRLLNRCIYSSLVINIKVNA